MVVLKDFFRHKKPGKLNASTLIETIIAMIIVSISFGVGITIYANMQASGNPVYKTKAFREVDNIFHRSFHNQHFTTKKYQYGSIQIIRKLETYTKNENLKVLSVRALDAKGALIYRKRRIIYPARHE